jgi:hypothetical protein
MAAAIIADSDDEGDDHDMSTVPITRRGDILQLAGQQTGYSDSLASLTTSSTDPAYFQSIYKEQVAAAAQQQQQQGQLITPQEAGTQQTWEATDPVSLPSQYVNIHTVTDKTNGLIGVGNVGDGVEGARTVAGTGDLWDVPSSPEQGWSTTSRRGRSKKDKGDGSSRPLRVNASNGNGNRGRVWESDDASRAKKRPKLDQAQDENAEFAQRQVMDRELQNGTAEGFADSSLPPTMPMQSDPPLVITTQLLSNSQRMEYQNVELLSSRPDENMQSSQQSPAKETATAGPRKRKGKSSSKQGTRKRQAKKKRQELSEEIIVVEDPAEEATQDHAGYDDAGIPDAQLRNLPDSDDAYEDEIVALDTQTDGKAIKPPTKPNKRGRPRKSVKEEKTEDPLPEPASEATREVSQPAKKKRGRPRKEKPSEIKQAIQSSPVEGKVEVAEDNDTQHNVAPAADVQPAADRHTIANDDTLPELADTATDDSAGGEKMQAAKEGKSSDEAKASSSTVLSRKQPLGKQLDSKASTSAGGKPPLYRVGLSRRSRITPLLKIVRK